MRILLLSVFLIVSIFTNGFVRLDKNGEISKINMSSPLRELEKASTSNFKKYLALTYGGFSYLLDVQQEKVLVTWKLLLQKDGSYKREMIKGKQDAYGMIGHHKQLLNRSATIGTSWKAEKTDARGFSYATKYTFEKIKSFEGKSIAQVDIEGKILWQSAVIGSVKGYFYHDYKNGFLRFFKIQETVNEKKTDLQGNQYITEIKISKQWSLRDTNAKKQKGRSK